MAQQQHNNNNKDQQHQNQQQNKGQQNSGQQKRTQMTPMIVERVNKIPVVQLAVSMGFSQYDKLKSSNVTVGDLMSRAESIVGYFWSKVAPIVEKFQGPISKADQLACSSLDFVEGKLSAIKTPQK